MKKLPQEYVILSEQNIRAKNYNKVIQICTEALSDYPARALFYFHKGFALIEVSMFQTAMSDFRTAVDVNGSTYQSIHCHSASDLLYSRASELLQTKKNFSYSEFNKVLYYLRGALIFDKGNDRAENVLVGIEVRLSELLKTRCISSSLYPSVSTSTLLSEQLLPFDAFSRNTVHDSENISAHITKMFELIYKMATTSPVFRNEDIDSIIKQVFQSQDSHVLSSPSERSRLSLSRH
ncbi:MAG: hypothetical protein ACHQ1D_02175 [Nitrososphaerales archaeon]